MLSARLSPPIQIKAQSSTLSTPSGSSYRAVERGIVVGGAGTSGSRSKASGSVSPLTSAASEASPAGAAASEASSPSATPSVAGALPLPFSVDDDRRGRAASCASSVEGRACERKFARLSRCESTSGIEAGIWDRRASATRSASERVDARQRPTFVI